MITNFGKYKSGEYYTLQDRFNDESHKRKFVGAFNYHKEAFEKGREMKASGHGSFNVITKDGMYLLFVE